MRDLNRIAHSFDTENAQSALAGYKRVKPATFLNTLNYINFKDENLYVNFKNKKYKSNMTLKANPLPCMGSALECVWDKGVSRSRNFDNYEFLNIFVCDGLNLLLSNPSNVWFNNEGALFSLDGVGAYIVRSREMKRYRAVDVQAELLQSGMHYRGSLMDFSALYFHVDIKSGRNSNLDHVNSNDPVYLVLKKSDETVFSGECMVSRQGTGREKQKIILKAEKVNFSRYRSKKFRSTRQKLSPMPSLLFDHPFAGQKCSLRVKTLSGSGLSIEEFQDNSLLIPGMIIPDAHLEFANQMTLGFKAQVINRKSSERDEVKHVTSGLAILDMDLDCQASLAGMLYQAEDEKTYVCNSVNLDALWEFFFKTGFFNPTKYAHMHKSKEAFKQIYSKIYCKSPGLARHFIYQDRGSIIAHISMLRFFDNAWLFHHHSANSRMDIRGGIAVLTQIGRYVNDFSSLASSHMKYVLSYYRPQNRFPHKVFGGFAKHVEDQGKCSLDRHAYMYIAQPFNGEDMRDPASGIEIAPARAEDLRELGCFYKEASGGLMLEALGLESLDSGDEGIAELYARLSLKRERKVFSIRSGNVPVAILLVSISDNGLNLSNFTNCITAIILDGEAVSPKILRTALVRMTAFYDQDIVPVLVYPESYAIEKKIQYEKTYNLWITSSDMTDEYQGYMKGLLQHGKDPGERK